MKTVNAIRHQNCNLKVWKQMHKQTIDMGTDDELLFEMRHIVGFSKQNNATFFAAIWIQAGDKGIFFRLRTVV
jgi:hypothetical protein